MNEPGNDSGSGARSRARWSVKLLRRRRLTFAEARRLLVTLVLGCLSMAVTIWIVPGMSASLAADVVVATVLLAILAALLRPLLTSFALLLGWAGVLLAGLGAQALLFYLALSLSPGITVDGFWHAFWGSWIFAFLMTVVTWMATAGDSAAFLTHLIQRAGEPAEPGMAGSVPGVVFVQIDGLAAPLLRWSVRSGDLPTLSRWIRSGSHRLTDWHAQLPATTPASQAGLLHGGSDQIPAFRWYEKETGRLLVANRPRDAAVIQARLSDGRGLLADGGVSISNIFSGDAPTSLLTMSGLTGRTGRRGPSRTFATFFINPYGLTRSVVLTVAEMVKEIHQSRLQRVRRVEPRIRRHGSYILLRAVTNVLLRDLNAGLIADQMMAGTPSIYCDFTDYDEIAHHAGPTRPESLASLAGIDHLIGVLEHVAARAPRPYRFVVLSDHGQSQGATFLQRHGVALEEVVRRLMGSGTVAASTGLDETVGPVNTFLTQVAQQGGTAGRLTRRALHTRTHDGQVELSPAPDAGQAAHESDLVLIASGNLSMIYFTRLPGRLVLEDIEQLYPGLVGALTQHPGIGFITVRTGGQGTVVLGRDGIRHLHEDRVEGVDPLAGFGPHAVADVLRHDALAHVGDLVINSPVDPDTDEVAAYEELVGCHGGLGGWQTEAVLVHPKDWVVAAPPLIGADAVHRQLVRWLEQAGQRGELRADDAAPGGTPALDAAQGRGGS
ncbi:phage holin family protein [Actinoplanes sp. NPDC049118]|uniref:phage holin family protein n=1 Tax=Actinoplanes sp. NPDC049118 TaxID=3155769 RepID=UPI003402345F